MIRSSSFLAADVNFVSLEHKAHDARITTIALTVIMLVLTGVSLALFGISTLPPQMTMGLGMFASLGGIFFGTVAGGVFIGALTHLAILGVRNYQLRRNEIR